MALTWKDGIATVLVAATALLAYATVKGFNWPLLSNWRMGSLVLLTIGLGTCIVIGSNIVPTKDVWTITATVLGGLAFVLALAGIILNSKVAFIALAVNIIVLWLLTTVHHLITTGA